MNKTTMRYIPASRNLGCAALTPVVENEAVPYVDIDATGRLYYVGGATFYVHPAKDGVVIITVVAGTVVVE